MLGPIRTTSAAVLSKQRQRTASAIIRRALASSVEVEHGRGQWKTYGDIHNYTPGKYQIKTFNKISPKGMAKFDGEVYEVRSEDQEARNAHAILLRSHKLQESEVAHTVRAIAR